ncbi:MAG: hypothetical protein ONB57_10840, partial [candidate division KSB1 bacterium]|nr:hypothetical protein [candidate division KSB1 bacterium]MDZ7349325.1 hypothetical protein [candidate division KSB1 bacterium]MDZ7352708.1 hypothetical protein [candidate division KSB1 bacterium]MDZ7396328.1 hypothetical protein [candidate division KSB1 bacterium]MDZ7411408.1 hypothetical protein [candidate division KSB1 bacterium]
GKTRRGTHPPSARPHGTPPGEFCAKIRSDSPRGKMRFTEGIRGNSSKMKWQKQAGGISSKIFGSEFCNQIDPISGERRLDRDARPPSRWCIKNFANKRAVNSDRVALHTRHFFRTTANQHAKFRQHNSDSSLGVRVKHKQSAHENGNLTEKAISWEKSRDAVGKQANFTVRAVPHLK